ncbi:hypothetical protein GcM1_183001 [Golovinomyces cichoracearum]|uniref:UBL3-like ubiquitin domain-containing protein n=1 Tax=Golovinomyces cichoracearum TaxID=62708 RepID=A0A420J3I0_9PEZI|nr:hypothetical protein GcM1_183001 [Golovinomyces cichoracearum]
MNDGDTLCRTEGVIQSCSSVESTSVKVIPDTLQGSSSNPELAPAQYLTTKPSKTTSMSASHSHLTDELDHVQSATETPTPISSESTTVLALTLLLTSGHRFPYRIDEQYLTSRNVKIPGVTDDGSKDPYSISIYTLKELILREWREEWGAKPSSPSSIRLIFFGRLLDDNTSLLNCKFNNMSSNFIHMTVRPQDIADEEDASKSKILSRNRDNGETTAGCRCIIM